MQEGLLWFDADPKRDLTEKVARAADRYQVKFGRRPNLCYVHTSALELSSVELGGVRVVGAENVLRHHFWIGEEEDARALKDEAPPRASGKGRYICKRCKAEALDPSAASCWNCGYDGRSE